MEIKDQVVIVTGASRGLGTAIAKAFGSIGANVVVNYYQNRENAVQVAKSIGDHALPIGADVRDKQQVEKMVSQAKSHFGKPVTTVVNNALVNFRFDPVTRKDAFHIDWDDYQRQFEGSVQAALNTTQAVLADMKENRFGRIINIGTNLFQNPVVPYHDYTTGKAALLGFTRNMANELGQYGITVNMVSGGLLKTTDASSATTKEVFELIQSITPLRNVTSPEEVADVVLFFASKWGRAVTGQNLVVDGGLVMD
ncbi:3-oxoacyl-ACP reductase [Effusibacillus dendaii]|uniref:3-oxoacyl-ACP reductase n=1 Tax=Effusibacillus dendaii TaxID=2743772 RepID=A0A7I8DE05_9BACL|nr:3-oxoacyl-ACP reductase [Effusibacillus dendaii]BCJ88257.1 3-oxoacyl-ACP reductase [Effusibacillus dendaii]